jgi:hypothetical protein
MAAWQSSMKAAAPAAPAPSASPAVAAQASADQSLSTLMSALASGSTFNKMA